MEISIPSMKKDFEKIEGVKRVHDLHVWSLSDGKNAISAHLECTINDSFILEAADRFLREKY